MSGPTLARGRQKVEAIFPLAASGFGVVEARRDVALEPLDRLVRGQSVPGDRFCFAHCSSSIMRSGGALEMRDCSPCVMRKPAHQRHAIDAGDRRACGELAGRDHVERGLTMRGVEDPPAPWRRARDLPHPCGARSSETRGQFVMAPVARPGGDGEIRGGPGRAAHRPAHKAAARASSGPSVATPVFAIASTASASRFA